MQADLTPRAAADAAASVPVAHTPLPASQQGTPGGAVSTGAAELSGTDGLSVGVWEHSVGISTDTEQDEVFVIIHGRGRIFFEDGRCLHLEPGTIGRLLAGQKTRWEVDEPLRKVWVMPKDPAEAAGGEPSGGAAAVARL